MAVLLVTVFEWFMLVMILDCCLFLCLITATELRLPRVSPKQHAILARHNKVLPYTNPTIILYQQIELHPCIDFVDFLGIWRRFQEPTTKLYISIQRSRVPRYHQSMNIPTRKLSQG